MTAEVEERTGLDTVEPETPLDDGAGSTPAPVASEETQAGPPEAAPKVDLASEIAGRLEETQRATAGRLEDLQKQLARVESRFDRGGQDAASIREVRREIGELRGQLADIGEMRKSLATLDTVGELREALDLVLKRTLEPEELAAYERNREVARAARKEQELAARAERAEKALASTLATVHMHPKGDTPPTPQPTEAPANPAEDPEYQRAIATLERRIKKAGYDPADETVQKRILAAAGDVLKLPKALDRLEALTEALAEVQAEDLRLLREQANKAAGEAAKATEDAAKREAARAEAAARTAARTAVVTDRSKAGAGAKSYTTQRELEAAYVRREIDPATFKQLLPSLPY